MVSVRVEQFGEPSVLRQRCDMVSVRVEQFGEPSVLRLERHAAQPELLSPTQVLVAVSYAGVNPVDTYIRSGAYAAKPALPYTPGKDCAGVVLATGAQIEHVRVGERVWTYGSLSGTYAQQAVCEGWQVQHLPDSVSFANGAAIGTPFSTAYRALFARGGAVAGDVVFVHGASGGVGLAAVQLAAMRGCVVIGSASTPEGADAVRAAGAAHVVDHALWREAAAPLVLPQQPVLIVEMLASANLRRDLDAIAPGGRIVIVGSRGPIEIDPRAIMAKEVDVCGVMLARATPAERDEMAEAVLAGLRSGELSPGPVIELELVAADEAHARTSARSGGAGKIVLRVPSGGVETDAV
jgi:NADPH2:quinone reductase